MIRIREETFSFGGKKKERKKEKKKKVTEENLLHQAFCLMYLHVERLITNDIDV